ncbi:MAG: hypothetical protein IJJ23_11435, partial [Clostridia bacterium]|nr:hypothetical protein [Clostridia bacterium]
LPEANSADVRAGLTNLTVSEDGRVATFQGYAYLEEVDPADCTVYLVVTDPEGRPVGQTEVFRMFRGRSDDGASAEEISAFTARVYGSVLPDGRYLAVAEVESPEGRAWQYLDDSVIHFTVSGGLITLVK